MQTKKIRSLRMLIPSATGCLKRASQAKVGNASIHGRLLVDDPPWLRALRFRVFCINPLSDCAVKGCAATFIAELVVLGHLAEWACAHHLPLGKMQKVIWPPLELIEDVRAV